MPGFARTLKALGIVAGVLAIFLVLFYFPLRHSLVLWAVVFSLLLRLAFCFQPGFRNWCAASRRPLPVVPPRRRRVLFRSSRFHPVTTTVLPCHGNRHLTLQPEPNGG